MPVTVFVFYKLATKSSELTIGWLVLASLFFYGWWDYKFVPLIVASILFNYSFGYYIGRHQSRDVFRRAAFVVGICFNLGLLAYFKYADFFILNTNQLFALDISVLRITLPLGISFFTFQQIAFLSDTYKNKTQEYNFTHYCLFVAFFPQLIAGPIVHHKEVLPQFSLKKTFEFNLTNFQMGASIFIFGLFKKVIIADGIAAYATPVFSSALHQDILFFEAWGAALAYTFQLYFDFSGYADMAIGAALMMNIRLPINFNSPYKSRNIVEFWRRWHITLSTFLKDYLYIPLGGNRGGKVRRYHNLLITMLLGGIWHGAGWTFFVWGGLHGGYLIINHFWLFICQKVVMLGNIRSSAIWSSFAWLLTFLAVVMAWVLFRAESFGAAQNILSGMFGQNGAVFPQSIATKIPGLATLSEMLNIQLATGIGKSFILNYLWIFFAAFVALAFPNSQQIIGYKLKHDATGESAIKVKWQPNKRWALYIGALFGVSVLGLSRVGEFIYFQF